MVLAPGKVVSKSKEGLFTKMINTEKLKRSKSLVSLGRMTEDLHILVLNEGKFTSLDKDNLLPYKALGIEEVLINFLKKRLEFFGFKNYSFAPHPKAIKAIHGKYLAVVNIVNPFIDTDLLFKMVSCLEKYKDYDLCKPEGAVPGTEPDFVVRWESWQKKEFESLNCLEVRHDTQLRYNCQINLRKLKRIKIFTNLVKSIAGLEGLKINELMELLSRDEVFEKVISYFEDVPLIYLKECPHCKGELEPLLPTVSQPMIGFIPDSKPYHFQCAHCKLIVLSPTIPGEETHQLYDFYYREGQGKDFFLRIKSRFGLYKDLLELIRPLLPKKARGIDLGAGAGNFTHYVSQHVPAWNIVVSDFPETFKYFKYSKGVETKSLNFLKEEIGKNEFDLVTAWEVIEHIPFQSFENLLDNIHRALSPSGLACFSTPNFDSLLCQGWDFYNLCPPHHLLVFSESWMRKYFSNHPQFEIVEIFGESEIFINFEAWFKYWMVTSKNFQSRALAKLFLELLRDKKINKTLKDFFQKKLWGMSMIVVIRKKNKHSHG